MEQSFQQLGFFHILQQFRHFHWGSRLKVLTQVEVMTLGAIQLEQNQSPYKPGIYVSSLADSLATSVSMVSKTLRTLEEKGWVVRSIDPTNRRNTYVSLTDYGRLLLVEEKDRVMAVNHRVITALGEERVQRLLEDTQILIECFAKELGSG